MRALLILTLLSSCSRPFQRFDTSGECTAGEINSCFCASGAPGSQLCGQACDCISVRITPETSTVTAGGRLQLNALVSEDSTSGVTWSASAGSIDESGMFTAPGSASTVTITATSITSPARQATATVSVASVPLTPQIVIEPDVLFIGDTGVLASIVDPLPDLIYDWTISGGLPTSSTRGTQVTFDVTSTSNVFISVTATNAANERGIAALLASTVYVSFMGRGAPAVAGPRSVTAGRQGITFAIEAPVAGLEYAWRIEGDATFARGAVGTETMVNASANGTAFTVFVRGAGAAGQVTEESSFTVTLLPQQLELLAGVPRGSGTADGIGARAYFTDIKALTRGADGRVYVLDGNRIRQIDPTTLAVTTMQTQGAAVTQAASAIAVGPDGSIVLHGTNAFQRIAPDGTASANNGTLAVSSPIITVDASGTPLIVQNNRVMGVTAMDTLFSVVGAVDACALSPASFTNVGGLAMNGSTLWVAMTQNNSVSLREVQSSTSAPFRIGYDCANNVIGGELGTNVNAGAISFAGSSIFAYVLPGFIYRVDGATTVSPVVYHVAGSVSPGSSTGPGVSVNLPLPHMTYASDRVFVSGNNATRLMMIDNVNATTTGGTQRSIAALTTVSVAAGSQREDDVQRYQNGNALQAELAAPTHGAFAPNGDLVFTDTDNNCIRRLTSVGQVENAFGVCEALNAASNQNFANGPAATARFLKPRAVVRGADGAHFIADTKHQMIRRVLTNGFVTTHAGALSPIEETPADGHRLAAGTRIGAVTSLAIDTKGTLYMAHTAACGLLRAIIQDEVITLAGKSAGCAVDLTANANGLQADLPDLRSISLADDNTLYAVVGQRAVAFDIASPATPVREVCPSQLGGTVRSLTTRGHDLVVLQNLSGTPTLITINARSCVAQPSVGSNGRIGIHEGPLASASLGALLGTPPGLIISPQGDTIVFDPYENAIVRVRD